MYGDAAQMNVARGLLHECFRTDWRSRKRLQRLEPQRSTPSIPVAFASRQGRSCKVPRNSLRLPKDDELQNSKLMNTRRSTTGLTEDDSGEVEVLANDGSDEVRSKSQARREALEISALALKLIKLPRGAILALPLPEEVRSAVLACQTMKKNAQRRELRRIAKLLRESDSEPIAEALSSPSGRTRRMEDEEHAHLLQRQRLLEGGDAELSALIERHPDLDAQRLRQLIRQAKRIPEDPQSQRAKREVLKVIRELSRARPSEDEPGSSPDPDSPE